MSDTQAADIVATRRELLKAVAGAAGTVTLSQLADAAEPAVTVSLDGYTDQLSYQAGDPVQLHVSTHASRFAIEVARVGTRRQVVLNEEGLRGVKHPVPPDASSQGCRWPAAFQFVVPEEWHSGHYQVLLHAEEDGQRASGEAFFVVRSRHPGRDTKILIQLCTNTYNAYNRWGGSSLYGGPKGVSRRVSFDRPYIGFVPSDNFTRLYSGWRNWEQPFVAWAEAAGYSLDFAVNSDLSSALRSSRATVSC